METNRTQISTEQLEETGEPTLRPEEDPPGAAAGLLPASLMADSALAFRSLSGCKQKCDRLSGNCKSRCQRCCKKIYNGSKKRCNFGCGSIRPK